MLQAKNYAMFSLVTLATVCFSLGLSLLVLENWEYPPAYVVLRPDNPEAHWAKMIAPGVLGIHREFQITRDVRLRINRELVLKVETKSAATEGPEGTVEKFKHWHRLEMETTEVTYHPGFYRNLRELRLPTVPPGLYTIVNVVCWEVNFIREQCVDLPDVMVQIP